MESKSIRSGFSLPVLGLGTWQMGGRTAPDKSHDEEEIKAIERVLDLGITHIDTAELYGGGHAEELIAEAIKGRDRSKLFITSKVKGENLRYEDLLSSAQKSLARLKTNYLDLYLIHWPNPAVPLEETMKAMDELVDKGLVKNIGVSNFSVKEIREAQKYVKHPIVANQIEYNLFVRHKGLFTENMEQEIIPYCQENDILVIAWRPLVKGMIVEQGHPVLDGVAQKYGKTRAQVALNWLLSKKKVVTLVKTSNPKHMEENLGALGWQMEEEDLDKLNAIERD